MRLIGMRCRRAVALAIAIVTMPVTGPAAEPRREKPYGLARRTPWMTSRVVGAPDPPPPYRLVRAFPRISFTGPVCIDQEPTSDRLMVVEYGGKIYSFVPGDPGGRKEIFLDYRRAISSFSFHPRYAENGFIFVFSHIDPNAKPEEQKSRVSRFRVEPGSHPPRCRPESETIIVEWPGGGHNGGEAKIGPDGYLYIATGDSTGGSDPKATGQGVDDLLSVMMRLDVEHPDPGRAYSIPADNPFVGIPGARPEIWAYGFRNPWRFSFDPDTGQPWVGDVGQDLWEMIELVSRGSNHGWSVREGTHPFHPSKPRGPTPFVPPVVEHHHSECRSITGGYVYREAKFPELRGVYLYGDYQYGKMWGLRHDHAAGKVTWHQELADTAVRISSFGIDRAGSVYALDYDRGEIYQLERRPPVGSGLQFPRKVSETGLFRSVAGHEVAPGVIPYTINVPFWSDGAHKERFLALPGDARITFTEGGAWAFDDGAVTVKSFSLDMEEGNPASRRRIETRIMVKQDDHWVGYTYAWDDRQSDAFLVEAPGLDRTYSIKDGKAPGGVRRQVWHYPSRNECMFCHSRAAGFVLGLNTPQMNRDHDYGGVVDNQLRTLDHIGLFRQPLSRTPSTYATFPDPFRASATDLTARVKAYLHVNCAICHVSDGGGNSLMELSFGTKLEDARIVDERPIQDAMGLADARLIAPGDPERSVLYRRVARRGPGQMPPTSSNVVDSRGAELLREWITRLEPTARAPGAGR